MTEFSNQSSTESTQPSNNWNNPIQPEKPNNYLVVAIVATVLGLCSCIGCIIGIIAIVFATQVDTKYNMGDYAGAESASKNAKILSFIALGIFVLGMILNLVYYFIIGASLISQYQ